MNTIHVPLITPVENVCDQILREIPRQNEHFSVAHVLMNPRQRSLLHAHHEMAEIYVILKGEGLLEILDPVYEHARHSKVKPGMSILVRPYENHRLYNTGMTSLEHLVVAWPPFNSKDVHIHNWQGSRKGDRNVIGIPDEVESIDGAKVVAYSYDNNIEDIDLSIAFGRVIQGYEKRPHYHKNTTEWVYVIEGQGRIEKDKGQQGYTSITPGSWTQLDPGDRHALVNGPAQDMIAACICYPRFDLTDVHFD